jgi:UDP-N-acetyl-D-glucosamine dehydrogenase
MKISVVGLDYFDLPLAIQFARANVPVLGLVVDAAKVDLINQGHSYIRHIPQETIEEIAKDNRLSASTDFSLIKEVEAVIICVPTPLSKNREPDISFILETGRAIAPHLVKGTVADWAQSIVDTCNAMASVKVAPGKVWKA